MEWLQMRRQLHQKEPLTDMLGRPSHGNGNLTQTLPSHAPAATARRPVRAVVWPAAAAPAPRPHSLLPPPRVPDARCPARPA